jgi:succinate-acetate transporter protein
MSTIEERRAHASAGVALRDDVWEDGFARPRVFLQPIAAPSILGLAGFAGATFMVASIQAKWWGTPLDLRVVAPFCAMFGGVAQFLAGMWAYKARDAVATLAHGTWGAFWIGFGILQFLQSTGTLPTPAAHAPDLGFGIWFVALAFCTFAATLGAMLENLGVFAVLGTLTAGSALSAGGLISGGFASGWTTAGGWLFVISAGLALYTVIAMTLMSVSGRTILPTGALKKSANVPGGKAVRPIQLEWAEPGVKQGQ